jgi:hypothetical protein
MNIKDHVICGTCVGERERRAGVFESKTTIRAVAEIKPLLGSISNNKYTRYCCICGAATFPDYVCILSENQHICDGNHEEYNHE